jgi:hypothetical protein
MVATMMRALTIFCLLCLSPAHARAGEFPARFDPGAMHCEPWTALSAILRRVSADDRAMLCTANDRGTRRATVEKI